MKKFIQYLTSCLMLAPLLTLATPKSDLAIGLVNHSTRPIHVWTVGCSSPGPNFLIVPKNQSCYIPGDWLVGCVVGPYEIEIDDTVNGKRVKTTLNNVQNRNVITYKGPHNARNQGSMPPNYCKADF